MAIFYTYTQDAEGNTALHLAVERSSSACVEALIKNGASMRLRNANGILPCDVASHKIRKDMLENTAGSQCRSMVLYAPRHPSHQSFGSLVVLLFFLQVSRHVLPAYDA